MSEPVTPLNGARFDGAITVTEAPARGMITLRCDLDAPQLAQGLAALALPLPERRAVVAGGAGRSVAWMSPDELLVICAPSDVPALLAGLEGALDGMPHLAVDVSHARALFTLTGAGTRDVLAKGLPIDLRAERLPPGEMRRTRLGQLAAAVWFEDAQTAHLICFRSVAEHVFGWLSVAARKGSLPGYLS